MEPDKIIGTNYQLIRLLGKGGMGEAWLARSSGPRAEVALKFISEPLAHDPELRRRFEREARIQSALQNSNVVQILGGDFSGPLPFVVTEYCRSGNLNQVFSSASFSEMVQALLQVMQGLAAAHEQGVVHRDLKPTNILVHEKGLVKLADFGLAKLMERDTTTLTATGWGLGTLGYMAPEQLSGAKHVDERADIYSLGVIVAEMMTQVAPPFERYDLMDGLRNRFPGLNWERESRVIEVVIRSSAKNPDRRYGSVRELMETWQELLPALSAPVGIAEPSWSRGLRELTATDFEALARVVSGDLTQADYRGYKDEDHGDFTILMKLVEMGLVCGSEQHGEMSDGDPAGGIYSVVPTHAGRALCTALSALGDNWSQIGQFLGSSRTEKAEL